ncbi:AAA family ATPase [Candidatus Woesearchaeota archaeon]|nr:AAA family ATPase [Candidatus Woesearchaeota archaeon]
MTRKRIPRFKTGISGFDKLLKEGIPEGNAVIVEGGPGSGKTAFCLHVLHEACKKGKKVLYMSFEEPEDRLREHMEDFGFQPEPMEKKGLLRLKRFNALDIARSVEALLSEAKKELLIDLHPVLIPKDFKPDILVVDSLSSISSAFTGEENRFRIYMEQLFRYLESNHITSFLIREEAHPAHLRSTYTDRGEAISFLSDGIIVIYNVIYTNGTRGRAIEILKMRGEDFVRKIVEFKLVDKKGAVVFPEKLLKGNYQLT